jgi:hypothetical protein
VTLHLTAGVCDLNSKISSHEWEVATKISDILTVQVLVIYVCTRVGTEVSGLTYKSRARWKMLRGIYSAIYGEVNVSVSVCVEIKGDCTEK